MKHFLIVLISVILLVTSFFVFAQTGVIFKGYKNLKAYTSFFIGPATKLVENTFSFFENIVDRYVFLVHVNEQNIELKKKLQKMELELQRLSSIENENRRLRELLDFKEKSPMNLLPARIIGEDLKSWFRSIIIDKGRKNGIKEKMVVISTKGLVGLCVEVNFWHTKVMIINDVHSSVDAIVEGKEIRGILEGTGLSTLRLKYISKNENINKGDRIITSGRDGIYPPGLSIGVVTAVRRDDSGIFAEIEVTPYSDFRTINEVFVIR